ncbi:MAG TPA: adenylate/guanylate cyclase domain-containing protein [Ktedonobacteraceae bacterium]|nr:adenylate/guanylate cyclase domain-containing protein [Ktedonobacteraceae bacterium]
MSEERKLVTILFADVTGSTALGDELDPEDVRALMSRYYAHARRIVPEHGGTLEKFIGDAVMAVFGLPQAHGDDAERALATALALHDAIANDAVLNKSFVLRIGVNTGEVIATSNPSDGEFLVTGDAVNVAARLQQSANPGEILVGERTVHAARNAFLFHEMQTINARGKQQPLYAHALKCAYMTRRVEHPPLVGRRQDLLQLSVLLARTIEEERPQIVTVIAPAGTGKTRLLEEFLSRLDPADGFQIATVGCPPYGQTLAYWPLRSLLVELLGSEISKAAVAGIFRQGGYTQEDAARLTDFALTALNIESESEGIVERECIFMAWRLLIEVLAQQAPRILVFEDLHWASDNLLDLVEYLIHQRIQAPLLLIALSRPELLDRRPTWGGGRQNFTSLALQPLTMVQTRELVRQLVDGASPAIRERIVERSSGNPFFVLELVRGLPLRGLEDASALDRLPDTIHAAILARLDQLTAQERRVLQAAAVKQRYFHATTLQAMLDEYSSKEIDSALDSLLNHDLVVLSEGGNYNFRHMLIRDVAYGTLARTERIRLHCKVAQCFETIAGDRLDEFAEPIAYHYREAIALARQSAVPLALPLDCTKAIHFLQRAGALASRSGAFVEARAYLQSAIDIASESEHIHLYEQLGDCDPWSSQAVEAYDHALKHWRCERQDPLIGARLMRKLLLCYRRGIAGNGEQTKDFSALFAEARRLAEEAGDEDELWHVRVADLFNSFCVDDAPDQAADILSEKRKIGLAAAEYFERKGDWTSFSEALDGSASISKATGAYSDMLEISLRRLTAPDLPALERGDALQMVAKAYLYLGDYANCIATIEEALTHTRPGQPPTYLGSGVSCAIKAAFISGRWSTVSKLALTLKEMWEALQHDSKASFIVLGGYYSILQIALAREDLDSANAATAIIKRFYSGVTIHPPILLPALLADDPQKLGNDFLNTTEPLHIMEGPEEIIRFCNEHGMTFPQSLTIRYGKEKTQACMHSLEIASALAAQDYIQLAQAIDAAEADDLVVHSARMRIVLAQLTGDRAQLERARPVLERLGDRRFLCRLEEVEASLKTSAA